MKIETNTIAAAEERKQTLRDVSKIVKALEAQIEKIESLPGVSKKTKHSFTNHCLLALVEVSDVHNNLLEEEMFNKINKGLGLRR